MADLGNVFNPNEIPPDEGGNFEPIPAGDYLLQVVDSDLKEKDSGDCGLNLTIEVVDGEHQGHKIWDYLNIRHSSADAQRISQRRLADYCLVTGVGTIRDSEELHYKPFVGTVSREKRKDTGEMTNKVKRVRPRGGQAPAARPAAAQPARQTSAASPAAAQRPASNRPWANRATA